MEAIKVEHLSKSYQGKQALKDLNLSVEQGRVFGLLGANGAGKSTSIECILGTRKQDGGAVSVLGMNPRKDRKKLFQQVGVQFQEANYQNEIKVSELCEETILLTSHFMDEVEALCDEICILKKGECVFYGTVAQAIEASPYDKLEDAYLWYSDEEEREDDRDEEEREEEKE